MAKKTILSNEIAQNRLQIKRIYRTFWVLQAVAVLLSSEEDLGLEGLRKAKLSYNPIELITKTVATLIQDGTES